MRFPAPPVTISQTAIWLSVPGIFPLQDAGKRCDGPSPREVPEHQSFGPLVDDDQYHDGNEVTDEFRDASLT